MNFRFAAGVLAALFSLFCAARAQGPIVLFDPANASHAATHTKPDERFVEEKLAPRVRAHWGEDDSCDSSTLNVVGAADGSFTRHGAKQRVIVYELCQTGNGFANNGIAVVEGEKVIAHFAVKGGWNLGVSRVPDITHDGRDEIAIQTGGGMHQGYTGSSITILELGDTSAIELGVFLAYTNECETYVADKYCDRSYKLTTAPGSHPSFFAQKYLNRGTDEKPRWVASGKAIHAKRIGDLSTKYELIK